SPRRLLAVFCGLVVAGWVLNGPAWGVDPAPAGQPAESSPVELQQGSDPKRHGTMAAGTIRLKVNYGIAELDPHKLKQFSIAKQDNAAQASATLMDKTQLSGQLLAAPIITADGKPLDLTKADDLIVTFKHPKDASLVAAILGLITLCLMEIV